MENLLLQHQRKLQEQLDRNRKGLTLPHLFSDTNNEQTDAMKNFIGLTIVLMLLTVLTFYIWKKCLFEKYGAYIPIDKNIDVQ